MRHTHLILHLIPPLILALVGFVGLSYTIFTVLSVPDNEDQAGGLISEIDLAPQFKMSSIYPADGCDLAVDCWAEKTDGDDSYSIYCRLDSVCPDGQREPDYISFDDFVPLTTQTIEDPFSLSVQDAY